ncbi:MAG: ribonuclease [Sphingomicrobium sp.]
MPDWLIERGIGETRCALVEDGSIVEARILLDGIARWGDIRVARLKSGGVPAVAIEGAVDGGQEYLLPRGAAGAAEGSTISITVTRERFPGTEPWKRPLARLAEDCEPGPAPPIPDGETLAFPAPFDRLGEAGWDELIEEARSGTVRFSRGELRISATPAMTLIDVDGQLAPAELAVRGAEQAARAVRRLDIGGSIGIDLPTVAGRAPRQASAEAIDAVLPKPFERTAVNGFGFVQIVRPRRRASLVELAGDRSAFEARALLRRAALGPPGRKRLTAHTAVISVLEARPDWLEALALQVGGSIDLRADASLAISGAHAACS